MDFIHKDAIIPQGIHGYSFGILMDYQGDGILWMHYSFGMQLVFYSLFIDWILQL
jgi:hypothetical protein